MQSKMLRTLLVVCCYALALAQKQVDTQYGPVVSHVVNVSNGETQTTIDVYYGIPFAADTSGNNRFRASSINLDSMCTVRTPTTVLST